MEVGVRHDAVIGSVAAVSGFTWLWIAWGLAFVVIEGVALFNSSRGDTLSEHVWAWLGVRQPLRYKALPPEVSGHGNTYTPIVHTGAVTPKWTLRVARIVLISFMVWLILHFVTGGWV
jgi:hypothetical protein